MASFTYWHLLSKSTYPLYFQEGNTLSLTVVTCCIKYPLGKKKPLYLHLTVYPLSKICFHFPSLLILEQYSQIH